MAVHVKPNTWYWTRGGQPVYCVRSSSYEVVISRKLYLTSVPDLFYVVGAHAAYAPVFSFTTHSCDLMEEVPKCVEI